MNKYIDNNIYIKFLKLEKNQVHILEFWGCHLELGFEFPRKIEEGDKSVKLKHPV